MWWELYTVWCGALRADWRAEQKQKEKPSGWEMSFPDIQQTHSVPRALMWQRTTGRTSKLNYIYIPVCTKTSRLPFNVLQQEEKKKSPNIWNGQNTERSLYPHCFCVFIWLKVNLCHAMWTPGMIICALTIQYPQDDFIKVLSSCISVPAASPRLCIRVFPVRL